MHLQHPPLLNFYKSEAYIPRNTKYYIYNISSKYISQYSTVHHIIACKNLVALSIAYIYQVGLGTLTDNQMLVTLSFILHACSYSLHVNLVEACLKLHSIVFPFIISLFQLI